MWWTGCGALACPSRHINVGVSLATPRDSVLVVMVIVGGVPMPIVHVVGVFAVLDGLVTAVSAVGVLGGTVLGHRFVFVVVVAVLGVSVRAVAVVEVVVMLHHLVTAVVAMLMLGKRVLRVDVGGGHAPCSFRRGSPASPAGAGSLHVHDLVRDYVRDVRVGDARTPDLCIGRINRWQCDSTTRLRPYRRGIRRPIGQDARRLRSAAAAAARADQVETMTDGGEAGLRGDPVEGSFHAALQPGGNRDVLHGSAARADQVMVVLRQVLRELVATEVLADDHSTRDVGALEHGEVAVERALRQPAAAADDFRDRHRVARLHEDVDELPPLRRVTLTCPLQSRAHLDVEIVVHRSMLHGMGMNENPTLTPSASALPARADARLGGPVELIRRRRPHSAASRCRSRAVTPRRATPTMANSAAATSTIVPPGASPHTRATASPATAEKTPIATAHRSTPPNDRPMTCALATGNTIIAATRRMPTMRIAATTAQAVRTASRLFANRTGSPATMDQSSSVTTENRSRRSRIATARIPAAVPRITQTSPALAVSGCPNRNVMRLALRPSP